MRHLDRMGKRRRRLVEERAHLGCHWCGLPFTSYQRPTIEHILPQVRGGTNESDNLALAHRRCNVWRSDLAFPLVPRTPQGKDIQVAVALFKRYGPQVLKRTIEPYRSLIIELAEWPASSRCTQ